MRIELKLVQSGLGGIWGMSVDRIAVRDVAAGAMIEFPAAGQWLGASPSPSSPSAPNQQVSQQQQAVIGVQSMRLMPAGTFAATFSARWVGISSVRWDRMAVFTGFTRGLFDAMLPL